jgi:hypothetical protein
VSGPKPKTGWDVLQYELREEQAATIGRLGRELQAALDALKAVARDDPQRPHLVDEAAWALWSFVVQRDCAGIRFTEQALKGYDVPREVRARMGVRPKRG